MRHNSSPTPRTKIKCAEQLPKFRGLPLPRSASVIAGGILRGFVPRALVPAAAAAVRAHAMPPLMSPGRLCLLVLVLGAMALAAAWPASRRTKLLAGYQ